MKRAALIALLLVGCASTGGQSLGSTQYIDAGPPEQVPAGLTREASKQISDSLAANDTTGVADLIASGDAVFVPRCTSGTLIDTAADGERELRLSDGRAVWVDTYWLKTSCT